MVSVTGIKLVRYDKREILGSTPLADSEFIVKSDIPLIRAKSAGGIIPAIRVFL